MLLSIFSHLSRLPPNFNHEPANFHQGFVEVEGHSFGDEKIMNHLFIQLQQDLVVMVLKIIKLTILLLLVLM